MFCLLRYFTLFMNLMSHCKAGQHSTDADGRQTNLSASQSLHQNTILAMSNLLNANIDTGLMYAIGKKSIIRSFGNCSVCLYYS